MNRRAQPIFFLTGFPGFLCSETLPRLLELCPEAHAYLLIQEKFLAQAQKKISELQSELQAEKRVHLLTGDLLLPQLGLQTDQWTDLAARVTDIFHFAAVYDLSVDRKLSHKINVVGTQYSLELARACTALRCFHHISTCYVSGRFEGEFKETALDVGQRFNNFYEETKFLAEVAVREAMSRGLPAMIFRPAIVVGHSKTGLTQKYDGPYFVIRHTLRQPGVVILPRFGKEHVCQLNLVPSDLVTEAIARLSLADKNIGKTFQIADPQAATIQEVIDIIALHTQKKIVQVKVPPAFAKALLSLPPISQLLKIPPETLDYFFHPTHYATDQFAQAMSDLGIEIPSFRDYAKPLIEFVKENPDLRTQAML